jgi:hypothetical protein
MRRWPKLNALPGISIALMTAARSIKSLAGEGDGTELAADLISATAIPGEPEARPFPERPRSAQAAQLAECIWELPEAA